MRSLATIWAAFWTVLPLVAANLKPGPEFIRINKNDSVYTLAFPVTKNRLLIQHRSSL